MRVSAGIYFKDYNRAHYSPLIHEPMPHACYNLTIFTTLSTANTFTYLTIYNVNWQ